MKSKNIEMKKLFLTLLICCISFSDLLAQQNNGEMYVPLEIAYFPGYEYRIPWEIDFDKSTWINILTFPLIFKKESLKLYVQNKEEYNKKANRILYKREECDSLVNGYVMRSTAKYEDYHQYGTGAYYIQENSGDRMYFRCVCIPARELMDLGHGDAVIVGIPVKYIEPKDFVFKFKRYGLDSLNLEEAPYYRIFPMDINPSFDCSKAKSVAEKTICRDSTLAALDRKLVQQFKVALKKKGEEVRNSQKAWLSMRDKECEGKTHEQLVLLLKSLYEERIQELSAMANE